MGLRDSVELCLSKPISRQQKVDLYGHLMLYVFRGCVQADVRSWLQESGLFETFDFLKWRRSLHKNGALLRNVKIFTYSRHCNYPVSPSEYELDRKELHAINLACEFSPLRDKLDEYYNDRRHPLGLELFDRFLGKALSNSDIEGYTRRYISKKMSFLICSYGESARDIRSDLMSSAIYTIQKTYPRFDDLGHMIATAKSAIKKRGVNFIKEHTTQKRQKLIQNSDGTYQKNTVAFSSTGSGVSDPGSQETGGQQAIASSYLVTGLDGLVQSSWERTFALKQLRESDRITNKQKTFLSLLLGEPCPNFSAYLGMPNDVAIETVEHSEYLEDVCSFLVVEPWKASAFLESLQDVL